MKPKLKKALKITGITLGSLLGLLILAVVLVCVLVFSSSSLTNVAGKAIDKYSPARAKIDDVDLTLVGSYPFLGFRLNGLVVYDDMPDSPSDTLAAVDEFTVTVDFKTLYKERKIILTNLYIKGVQANAFTAADGRSNLDVFGSDAPDEPEPEEESSDLSIYADLQKISIHGINASYIDLQSGTDAGINGIDIDLKGLLNYDSLDARTAMRIASVKAAIRNDSTDVAASMDNISLKGKLSKYNDDVKADLTLGLDNTSASMDGILANAKDLEFTFDDISCSLGKEGLKDLVATLGMSSGGLTYSSEGMSTSTGSVKMRIDKAAYMGDSVSVSGFSFDSREISLTLEDSLGTVTRAGIEKLLLKIDAGLRTDLSNAVSALTVTVEGTEFEQGGDTAMSVITDNLTFSADASVHSGDIKLDSRFATPSLYVTMGSEEYVPGWPLSINLPVETNMDVTRFSIREGAGISVNNQRIGFSAAGTMGGSRNISGRARVNTVDGLDIDRLVSMIPAGFRDMLDGIGVHGVVDFDINVRGGMNDCGPILDDATASLSLKDFDASVNDSLKAASSRLTASVTYPSKLAVDNTRQTADVAVSATNLDVTMVDSTTINASIDGFDLNASVAGLMEAVDRMNVQVDIRARQIQGDMDTIFGTINNTWVKLNMAPADSTIAMAADLEFERLTAGMGSMLSATLGNTSLQAFAQYDSTKTEILNQWNPHLKVELNDALLDMLASPVCLSKLDFDFSLGRFNINDCRVEIDESDIQLWGDVYNIGAFMDGTGLLTGELSIESDYMNLNRLMGLTGDAADDQAIAQVEQESQSEQDTTVCTGPIMIPKGIDLTLYTNLSKVDFNNHTFNNVGGDVSIRDGVITLQELGFSSNAAEMQLTAIYRTPDVEDRFMELDFHLLDIEIDELIDLVPAVDSVVPMLKSLSGKAQFHLSAQTYLDDDYAAHGPLYPLMYSLIGNAVIEGANLVVLDNEIFDGIKRKLLMSKDAKPVIDSLDIELQVLDGKVDLYPARIKMDRYEAIISGRHNIDAGLNCSYNISLTKCPLPIRLGVTISGPLNDIAQFPIRHIKVGRAQYGKLYRPEKSGKVEADIMRRKNAILDASRSNVRPRKQIEN